MLSGSRSNNLFTLSILALILLSILAAYSSNDIEIGCDSAELIAAINNANADPDPETIILGASCLYSLTDFDNLDFRDGMDEEGFLVLDQFRLTSASM